MKLSTAKVIGDINYGIGDSAFYIVAGIANLLGWGGLVCYEFYKRFIKKD